MSSKTVSTLATEFRNQFDFDPKGPIHCEGWLHKAKMRFSGPHWQRRYFRLQSRCLFYFKKDVNEPPCGYIPLLDIEFKEPPTKGKKSTLAFTIKLGHYLDQAARIPKRLEYPIQAESEDSLNMWKRVLTERCARWIFGQPYEFACSFNPNDADAPGLLPYFMPSFLAKLELPGELSKRGIWATEVPSNVLAIGIVALNLNLPLPLDDTQNAIGYVMQFLKELPECLLPPNEMSKLAKPEPEQLRELILARPAPIRQLIRELVLQFNRALECKAQNRSNETTFRFFDRVLIRDASGASPSGEAIRKCLMANATFIFNDVHQLEAASRQPILYRGRLRVNQAGGGRNDILAGERGLMLNIVREDEFQWCTVFTTNGRQGLVPKMNIVRLTPQEEEEAIATSEMSQTFDGVREKLPGFMLLFESMQAEINLLERALP
jgi:hypothetical protein